MDTMKPQYRTYVQVMLLSLACVILIWLADAVLDARYTSQTLWQSLLSLRPHEYVLRGILVFLGLMVALESTVLWEARARVRRQLEESEAKYRALFEAAPAGVFLELLDGTIVECNDRAAEMLGYTKEELCGKHAADVVPPEIAQTFPAFVERELRDGWAMVEAKAKRKDGSIFPTEVGTRLVHLAGVPYVVVYVQDITARKEAEMALAAEKERLRVTLRSIGEGVITSDVDGRVLLMNPIAEELTGWRQEEALGLPMDQVMHTLDPVSREVLPPGTLAVLADGRPKPLERYECVLVGKDGREHVVLETIAPIRDDAGRALGAVVVFRDITEQRKMEEERQRALRLGSLAKVASGIAHDFRNYLSSILTNVSLAELCLDQPAEAREAIRRVRQAIKLAQSLTEQLLLFSSGREPERRPGNIADVIAGAAELATSGTSVTCRLSLPPDLWPISMDVTQMNQAISNLVLNAVQAMSQQGVVDIVAENLFLPENSALPLPAGPYVHIAIRDYGPGIRPDDLPHIFDPYFTTRPNGTGLGLSVAHGVVQRHGGHLTVESIPNQGSTFHIYLPAAEPASSTTAAPIMERPAAGHQHRVLVLDDDEALCISLSLALSYLGYYVECARTGEEALARFEKARAAGQPFHAVIVDLAIAGAGMDGKQAAQQILQRDPDARLIVTSGLQDDPAFCRYQEWGFAAALAKPFDISDVVRTLQHVLGLSSRTQLGG
jgi:PAS domain S-box-containing protein